MSKSENKSFIEQFGLKQVGDNLATISMAGLGVCAAYALNKKLPEKAKTGLLGVGTKVGMLLGAAYVSTKVNNDLFKKFTVGVGAYGLITAVSQAANMTPEISGLGYALPEPVRNIINDIVPAGLGEPVTNHSDFNLFAPGTYIPAEEATYELLNAANGPLNLPELASVSEEIASPSASGMGYLANVA